MIDGLIDLLYRVWLPLVILIGAGGLWQRVHPEIPAPVLRNYLSTLAVYLFLPALIFAAAATARIDRALLTVPFYLLLGTLATGLVLYLALYRSPLGKNLPNRTRAALLLCGMFGNVLLIGYPVLGFLYGHEGERYAVFADVLAFTPIVWTLGVLIATRLGAADVSGPVHPVTTILLRLPPVWAFVLGVALNLSGLELAPLADAARMVGQAAIPLLLFVLGLALPWGRLRPSRAVLSVVAVKLALMPLIVWGLIALSGHGFSLGEQHRAAILEAGMPAMTTSVLLADRFHLDTETVALLLGWSTLLFALLLPVWVWLFS